MSRNLGNSSGVMDRQDDGIKRRKNEQANFNEKVTGSLSTNYRRIFHATRVKANESPLFYSTLLATFC